MKWELIENFLYGKKYVVDKVKVNLLINLFKTRFLRGIVK